MSVSSSRCAFVCALFLALSGCGLCSGVGCTDGLHEVVFDVDGLWPAGTYELVVQTDDDELTCSVTLPTTSCHVMLASHCKGRGALRLLCDEVGRGAGLDGFSFVRPAGATPTFEVALRQGDKTLAQTTHHAKEKMLFPNGERCAPACRVTDPTVLTLSF